MVTVLYFAPKPNSIYDQKGREAEVTSSVKPPSKPTSGPLQ